MKYLKYLIVFGGTLVGIVAGAFLGMYSTLQQTYVINFWIDLLIILVFSLGFAFFGFKITKRVVR
jgi:hypothetical protein